MCGCGVDRGLENKGLYFGGGGGGCVGCCVVCCAGRGVFVVLSRRLFFGCLYESSGEVAPAGWVLVFAGVGGIGRVSSRSR